ncbi:MAG: site-specific integrase [Variovorax sp.]
MTLEISPPLIDHNTLSLLDPQKISAATAESVNALLRQGESANTRASYGAALRYWGAWYSARYGHALRLPLAVPVIVQFIADHAVREVKRSEATLKEAPVAKRGHKSEPEAERSERRAGQLIFDLPPVVDAFLVGQGYKGKRGAFALNTLVHRVSVISKVHQNADVDNPCNHPGVRKLLSSVRRSYASRGVTPTQQSALTKEPLELVLATCDDSVRGKRDRALLLFAWASGGRRRSEVTDATMENLHNHGERGYVYVLARSKSNQEGKHDASVNKPVAGIAAAALSDWLAVSGITEGPIFRRLLKGGRVTEEGLDPKSVRDIVQKRCLQAGVMGRFSAHSLRSGFVTEAGRRQVPTAEAMRMTGHKSVDIFMGYYRSGDVLASESSRLMDSSNEVRN